MADPNDIYKELSPSGLPVDNIGFAQGTPGFDPNSTARDVARAADDAARAAAGVQTPLVTVAPNSAADEWNATFQPGGENYSLTPSQWNDLHPVMSAGRRRHEAFGDIDAAHQTAQDYHGHTAEAIAKVSDARKNIESADFAHKLSTLDHADPRYSEKFADLVALHPNAGGKLVDAVIADKQNSRETYMKAVDKGGASAYGSKDNPTPAYNAFIKSLAKDKDLSKAHAAADFTMKNEAELDTAAKKGLLTAADIPAWDDSWHFTANDSRRPKVWNRDATLNYGELKKVINQREGAGQSLADQRKQVSEDRMLISTLGPQVEKMEDTDPNKPVLRAQYQEAVDRLDQFSKTKAAQAPATAAVPTVVSNLLPPPRKKK